MIGHGKISDIVVDNDRIIFDRGLELYAIERDWEVRQGDGHILRHSHRGQTGQQKGGQDSGCEQFFGFLHQNLLLKCSMF